MKNLKIIYAASLASLQKVNEFERKNNLQFPIPFKDFLINHNPIEVEENQFPWNTSSREIDIFYPFHEDHELSLQKIFNNLNEVMFENKYIAFAGDPGGWKFVISVQEQDYGKVYFCRMDEELEDALTLLADSFDDFINGLRKPEDFV